MKISKLLSLTNTKAMILDDNYEPIEVKAFKITVKNSPAFEVEENGNLVLKLTRDTALKLANELLRRVK